ncbi:MAG: SUMF1/EgtB/PvdO family nonheme iron enzyme [Patescibacteria group bacterium]|nr:SUMF1/EgtB/PvdO family nonheme iron enzyme [Patescibacteria group bacterium]
MPEVIQLKTKKSFWKRQFIVIIIAVVLTTVGIKASDYVFNSDGEIMGVEEGCEEGMVFVPFAGGDFCVDKYEASPGFKCQHFNPQNQIESRDNLDFQACIPVSQAGAMPWRNISQDQAVMACAKAGKRLPTYEEWFAAALGTPDPDFGWDQDDCQVNQNWDQQPGKTGSGKNCLSGANAYDMIGNVWEWVAGTVKDGDFNGRKLPKSGYIDSTDGNSMPGATNANEPNPNYNEDYAWIKDNGLKAIARGGFWDNKSEAGQYSVYIETSPSFAGSGIGFRCVK